MTDLERRVVAYLQRHPDSGHPAIRRALGAPKRAVLDALRDLEYAGLVRQTRRASPRRWAATPLPPTDEVAPPVKKQEPRRPPPAPREQRAKPQHTPPARPAKEAEPQRTQQAQGAPRGTVTVALPSGWKPASEEGQLLYELPTPLRRLARK